MILNWILLESSLAYENIIDEVESTYVMLTLVFQKLGSPILQPSTTVLRAYDDLSTKAQGIILNVPISLANKTTLI